MPSDTARRAKRIAGIALAIAAGLVVLLLVGTPLVLRGERFAWAFGRLKPATQGPSRWAAARSAAARWWRCCWGARPACACATSLILDPEGVEVFAAADISAAIQVHRNPWRVTVHDLEPGRARWRMAPMRERRGIGFLSAFLPPRRASGEPAGAGGPARPPPPCARPPAPTSSSPSPAPTSTGSTASFDFPGWGLVLNDIRGRGELVAGQRDGRPVLRFEVAGVDARGGGLLRILSGRAMTAVPFDRVLIDRVGTPADTPADLLLLVTQASTGRSRLGGRALFAGLFACGASGAAARACRSGRLAPGRRRADRGGAGAGRPGSGGAG